MQPLLNNLIKTNKPMIHRALLVKKQKLCFTKYNLYWRSYIKLYQLAVSNNLDNELFVKSKAFPKTFEASRAGYIIEHIP